MEQVTIVDARTDWMRKEDGFFLCLNKCKYFEACNTRCGYNCKLVGGEKIPQLKGRLG